MLLLELGALEYEYPPLEYVVYELPWLLTPVETGDGIDVVDEGFWRQTRLLNSCAPVFFNANTYANPGHRTLCIKFRKSSTSQGRFRKPGADSAQIRFVRLFNWS